MDVVLVLLIGVLVRLVIPLALLLLISDLIGRRYFRLS